MTLLARLRHWRDNSAWHHHWLANGPLWWLCSDCRAIRRPMRCEQCGAPAQGICHDADDPWPLCPAHADALAARLNTDADEPRYTLEDIEATINERRARES